MKKVTYEEIQANAQLIKQWVELETILNCLSLELKRRELIAIALQFDEFRRKLLKPHIARACKLLELLEAEDCSLDELMARLECSESTVRQTIRALRSGGIEFQEGLKI